MFRVSLGKTLELLSPRDKVRMGLLFFMMLVSGLLEVVGVGVIPAFVMVVASPAKALQHPVFGPILAELNVRDAEGLLFYGALTLIVIFVVKNLYAVYYNLIFARFVYKIFNDIGEVLFGRYMRAPYTFHLGRNSAELVRNSIQETYVVAKEVLESLLRLVMSAVLIVSIGGVLFWAEPWVALIATVFLGSVAGISLKVIRQRVLYHGNQSRKARKSMIQAVQEGLGGVKDIRILGRESWFVRVFATAGDAYARGQIFKQVLAACIKPLIETCAVTGLLLMALAFSAQGRTTAEIVSMLSLFGVAAIRLMPALNEFMGALNTLRFSSGSVERVHADMTQSETQVTTPPPASPLRSDAAGAVIGFRNVTFSYPNTHNAAVQDLSLDIRRGEVTAFVGPSGSGKTTIVDLILGLLEPQSGHIYTEGVDIFSNLPAWRARIGYVPQNIFLTDGTLAQNIALGVPESEVDAVRLQAAIRDAQLEDLIRSLPSGLNTRVGERGVRISGGQRQRVGIARALYPAPSVLVLDEATSALDNATERDFVEAIERLRGNLTIVMVAHRMTTVRACDRLFLVEAGRLVASGSYEELLESSAGFQKIV
jgi:ABC-type multidrug transport system fused ATPase/permease subunit